MIFAVKLKTINIKRLLCIVITVCLILMMVPMRQKVSAASDSVMIYQIQTGASGGASQEYVSLYNNSSQPIDVTNWCVIYSSASDLSQSQLGCFSPPDVNTKIFLGGHKTATLASSDFLQANNVTEVDLVFSPGLSASSGHIKLLDANKTVIDKVGWGSAAGPESSGAAAHSTGAILQRVKISEQILQDLDNNSMDFYQTALALPSSGGVYEEYIQPESEEVSLAVTELLPDAIGADSGKEFIEIYNPSDQTVNLKNYMLQIGPNFSKSYSLPDILIQPKSYLALSDDQTGITLPNTSGSVRMVGPAGNNLSTTGSYEDPGEGVAWAFIGSSWQVTYRPTPNAGNILLASKPCPEGQVRSTETGYCRNAENKEEAGPASCRSDQERNPETNRCRKIASLAGSLLPCKAGQVRNPETGRCRSIASAAAAKVPCKPGQERNPETGRCRKTVGLAAAAKPCPAGQERNKETNRCRKAASGLASKNKVKDVESPLVGNNIKWWVAGFSAMGSVGYAIYEWRREAFGILSMVKGRFIEPE